ncbi:MAG TPA: zinc-dependent alcohol dehydrogenase family protein [Propionibacteriaceae bacterium]|nr:zinc-dependent alcohol dehydrogenase family protein [Propionibacteriaceae bacterium]
MKAVRYQAPGDFAVTDVPMPPVGPLDVLIKVHQSGICGTDVHLHHGTYIGVYPLTPGHETIGEIEEVGTEVTRFQPGQRVTVNPNIYCGQCEYCLAGQLVRCANTEGMGVHRPGFFAEYASADHRQVFSVDGLESDTAVFAEPTACAMHGLETLGQRPGGSALVIGAGPTGLLLAQLIGSGGATSVTVGDIVPFKLETAAGLGVDSTVSMTKDPAQNIDRLRAASPTGDGYDVVVEATGTTAVGNICVPLTRNGGTVLVYGVTRPDERLSISPFELFRREITIKGSYAEMTSFAAAISALRTGRARTDGIISHKFPLDDYDKALEALASDPTAHKVVVDLRS